MTFAALLRRRIGPPPPAAPPRPPVARWPPGRPDPVVFGTWAPEGMPEPGCGEVRHCAKHPGITWRGDGPCWACEPGAGEFSPVNDDLRERCEPYR